MPRNEEVQVQVRTYCYDIYVWTSCLDFYLHEIELFHSILWLIWLCKFSFGKLFDKLHLLMEFNWFNNQMNITLYDYIFQWFNQFSLIFIWLFYWLYLIYFIYNILFLSPSIPECRFCIPSLDSLNFPSFSGFIDKCFACQTRMKNWCGVVKNYTIFNNLALTVLNNLNKTIYRLMPGFQSTIPSHTVTLGSIYYSCRAIGNCVTSQSNTMIVYYPTNEACLVHHMMLICFLFHILHNHH